MDTDALITTTIVAGVVFGEISAPWLLLAMLFYLLSLGRSLRS
jgi:hypothetical protein